MSEKSTPICNFGQNAYDFNLGCTNGKNWTLDSLKGERGLLIFSFVIIVLSSKQSFQNSLK